MPITSITWAVTIRGGGRHERPGLLDARSLVREEVGVNEGERNPEEHDNDQDHAAIGEPGGAYIRPTLGQGRITLSIRVAWVSGFLSRLRSPRGNRAPGPIRRIRTMTRAARRSEVSGRPPSA